MTLDEMQAGIAPTAANDGPREPFSAAWWQNRSAEELRDIIKRRSSPGAKRSRAPSPKRSVADAKQPNACAQKLAHEAEQRKKRMRIIAAAAVAALLVLIVIGWLLPRLNAKSALPIRGGADIRPVVHGRRCNSYLHRL